MTSRAFSNRCRCLPVLCVCLLCSGLGCQSPPDFGGVWKGQREIKTVPGTADYIAHTLAKVTLTVEPNSRFLLINKGLPVAGELDTSGSQANLVVDMKAGQPVPHETIGAIHLSPDGTLQIKLAEDDVPISLTRDTQPGSSSTRTDKKGI